MIFRTRFAGGIVAEFAPPASGDRQAPVIMLCDGMPSMPRKQPLVEWLAAKDYWVIYPRWRGAWESEGDFLAQSPERDLSDILDALPGGMRESAFGRRFAPRPRNVFVIGGSFGGAAAILSTLDRRVTAAVANCPVVDWSILDSEQRKETSNPSYAAYIREAFGAGYRLSARNWNRLKTGRFFNPAARVAELDGGKLLLFHAQDDPYVPWRGVERFARQAGCRLKLLERGGHLSTDRTARRYWRSIAAFFARAARSD
ncbi:MAG TPA: alpha/beta fold hydrolase [Terriglobales bacterium]|nr:alpha/beta fold hydrolase [Terriglobales bacterium]